MKTILTKVENTKSRENPAAFYGIFGYLGRAAAKNSIHAKTATGDTVANTATIIKPKTRVIIAAIKYIGMFGNRTKRYMTAIIEIPINAIKRVFSIKSLPKKTGNFAVIYGSIKAETAKIIKYPIITEAI